MKAYICDQCGLRVEPPPSGYDLPPDGWYTINQFGHTQRHMCSGRCLTMHSLKVEADETAKTEIDKEATRG